MTSAIADRTLVFILTSAVLWSCSNQNPHTMTEAESNLIIKGVKTTTNKILEYTQNAQVDSFLGYYDHGPAFLAFSGDGKMRNYEEFKKLTTDYYTSVEKQDVTTIREKFNAMDVNLVIFGWTGNIMAHFKNGATMKMNGYSVTMVLKKIGSQWKVIHSHESSPPPEIMKQTLQ